MRKVMAAIAAVPLFALVASATDVPTAEAFLGYNFVRFNPNSGYIPSFNANGGGGQFVYNFNKWIGGVVDLGAVTKGTLNGFNVDSTVVNFVAGPRFTYHNHSRFVPFGQVLFGGAYATASAQIDVLGSAILPPDLLRRRPSPPVSMLRIPGSLCLQAADSTSKYLSIWPSVRSALITTWSVCQPS